MDGSASEIVFDESGRCNFCKGAQASLESIKSLNLSAMLSEVISHGIDKKYDVLIGLSGGVDSSYALHCAVELGLRPFCFTVDNSWNNPKADENIMRLVETLKVPLYRYVLDKKSFKELQAAFMKAGLPNIEIPTDHVLMATTYEMAAQYGIKYVISGGNVATESIMPASWGYNARDLVHIKDVFKRMMGRDLTGVPTCSLLKWNFYRWIKGIKIVYLLDYLHFNRNEAAALLAEKYGWQEYGGKHCENQFTEWFQNFYLFEKFSIDKRKAHLSSLIVSEQMTRDEALAELGRELYYPKLGLENRVMIAYPRRSHDEFKKDKYDLIAKFVRLWK